MSDEPKPNNGKPYYCKQCGAGLPEFMACEMPDCELESPQAAQARARHMKRADYLKPTRQRRR